MNVLVTGGRGQLGQAIVRRGAAAGHVVTALGHHELDICDEGAVAARCNDHAPDVVINAAAYTAVDKAEANRVGAFAVNADGAAIVARTCAARAIRVLHVSTDYVFDGTLDRPYQEDDVPQPISVYGESKLAGERHVQAAGGIVVRTSWLFGRGGPSFVHTILRLAAERPLLRVVADQRGCPTWADDLADALLVLATRPDLEPCYHFCGAEAVTWHAFASAIVAEARLHRGLACERIEAITTAEYPTPARRPMSSVLDTARIRGLGIEPPRWHTGLAAVVAQQLAEP
ncbi:MAG: dTDP-4-dehydrorhamnose reductase [Deltaproteobacteria bacterium]|nr:dTDP-4-dehydrorhamnose reductase [Deltaproteobacteria bacterium]